MKKILKLLNKIKKCIYKKFFICYHEKNKTIFDFMRFWFGCQ